MISSLGGQVLLSVADGGALAGLIICLANKRKKIQNHEYFLLVFVFTILLVSFTLGVSLKYAIKFDVPYELRILACFVLGICGLIIAGSSYKMYNYNFIAKWMFLGGFLVAIGTQISVLSVNHNNIIGHILLLMIAIYIISGSLVLMCIGFIYGIIKCKRISDEPKDCGIIEI